MIILLRVVSVSWILSYGLFAHLAKDGFQLRMISSIFVFYIGSLLILLAFESYVRYIILMYYMILLSNLGGLFMFRALHKSVQVYQAPETVSKWRRVYAILTVSYTSTILLGLCRIRGVGTRCDDTIVYPYAFLALLGQQLLQSALKSLRRQTRQSLNCVDSDRADVLQGPRRGLEETRLPLGCANTHH